MPLGEKQVIRRIQRHATNSIARPSTLMTGIGDDCAVLRVPPGHELLVTTDFTIENVHFRQDWDPPEQVGRRCLTRGLSDIAAMGGEPIAAFLSLALDPGTPQRWVDRFLKGLLDLAQEFKIPLAGGDTAQSATGIQADIVLVGSVPRGKAILRSGARVGDHIYVTGALGGASAELARLLAPERPEKKSRRQFISLPRLDVGRFLRQRGLASAMIDLSDGLSTDLAHLCEESRVGAEIESEAIPKARFRPGIGRAKTDSVGLNFALHGGDDYELLFTSSATVPAKIAGVPITRIGGIVKSGGTRLIDSSGSSQNLKPQGWEHFISRKAKLGGMTTWSDRQPAYAERRLRPRSNSR